jgi:hypothetical protein
MHVMSLAPSPPAAQHERIAVCSIEKANVAVNKMLAEGRLRELAAVVVDEVHMVTDPHRWGGGGAAGSAKAGRSNVRGSGLCAPRIPCGAAPCAGFKRASLVCMGLKADHAARRAPRAASRPPRSCHLGSPCPGPVRRPPPPAPRGVALEMLLTKLVAGRSTAQVGRRPLYPSACSHHTRAAACVRRPQLIAACLRLCPARRPASYRYSRQASVRPPFWPWP